MKEIDIFKNIKLSLQCNGNGILGIKVTSPRGNQEILTFEDLDEYYLYLWYDEGWFPKIFDTITDTIESTFHRLKIIGIDEI